MTPTEATQEIIESLISDLSTHDSDDFSESAYEKAVEIIRGSTHDVEFEIADCWKVIRETEPSDHQAVDGCGIDFDPLEIIFVFDREGDGHLSFCGNPQFWQGESWDRYPIRAVALIPEPERES